MRVIQLFTKDEQTATISDELVSFEIKDGCAWVKVKEGGEVYESMFPLWNVSEVRFFEEEE